MTLRLFDLNPLYYRYLLLSHQSLFFTLSLVFQQQHEETSFLFTPIVDGEVVVSCKIYPEMICRVTVTVGSKGIEAKEQLDDENTLAVISSALKVVRGIDVTVDADIRMGGGMITNDMLLSNHGDYLSESQSFVDSDDVFSCSDSQNQQFINAIQQKKYSLVTPLITKTEKGNESDDESHFLSRSRRRIAKSKDFKIDHPYSSDDDEFYCFKDFWLPKRFKQ